MNILELVDLHFSNHPVSETLFFQIHPSEMSLALIGLINGPLTTRKELILSSMVFIPILYIRVI